ncbi:MAG: hypothetical protein V4451_12610 [Pseudomonadota bacterium]
MVRRTNTASICGHPQGKRSLEENHFDSKKFNEFKGLEAIHLKVRARINTGMCLASCARKTTAGHFESARATMHRKIHQKDNGVPTREQIQFCT